MKFTNLLLSVGLLATAAHSVAIRKEPGSPTAQLFERDTGDGSDSPCETRDAQQGPEWPPHNFTIQETILRHHNVHRANHSAPPVQWGPHMYEWAKLTAESCIYQHNTTVGDGHYGQNIAAGVEPDYISQVLTDLMYNNEVGFFNSYGQANPDMSEFEHYGHFSQIVWKSTTHVACYTADCSANGLFAVVNNVLQDMGSSMAPYNTVCNYWPPGNVDGAWADNVGQPLGNPYVDAQY